MKKLQHLLAIAALIFAITSCNKENLQSACTTVCNNGGTVNSTCGCDCPSGYTGNNCEKPIVSIPTCQTNHTATVIFKNESVNGYTYTIYWDNVPLTSVSSGQTKSYPTGSNVQRKIYAKATKPNGTTIQSSTQTVIFKDCSINTFTWSF